MELLEIAMPPATLQPHPERLAVMVALARNPCHSPTYHRDRNPITGLRIDLPGCPIPPIFLRLPLLRQVFEGVTRYCIEDLFSKELLPQEHLMRMSESGIDAYDVAVVGVTINGEFWDLNMLDGDNLSDVLAVQTYPLPFLTFQVTVTLREDLDA